MVIKLPNTWDIKAISEEIGLDLEEEEILEYIELMGPTIESTISLTQSLIIYRQ